ncbi:branched-chain amino acid ABC transporter permease [Orrella dioscoreae]|uniref:Branched-chain amino acid transport system permease protein LivM (TC 3.A.1.4.1) n=2 Tax=root TaxID=1 RepID=A0A1C3K5I1_9BURK|nr:branched-chain amino acid ABC transporter permease [Orrella dioscoreae]SBT26780.1 Branched-chain amino acid transport system permease protein LivM (TC 3.A.1.4.1) [Orrella dioscoreae]SOE52379.1 Branched-chain amino acid transport system permease protein LivM (TC 3.A.1.4.1) [Orrella dioscoreae]
MQRQALDAAAYASQRQQDQGVDRLRYRIAAGLFVVLVVAMALVPMVSSNASFAFYLMLWIAMATGMNICVGFTGYLPFGYVVFYGVGAYATGICYRVLELPIFPSLLAAGAAGVLIALLMAPTLRLKGVYFGIVSLGLATIVRLLIANLPDHYTGGSMGLILASANNPLHSFYAMLAIMAGALALVLWLSRSRLGRQLRAIKDDAGAAACVGIDVPRVRLKAWLLAALIPALVGGVEAWYTNVVDPEYSFHVLVTAKSIIYGMAGGFGTILGPVVGTIALYGVDHFIWERFPLLNLLLLGLVIIGLMLFLPRGVVGSLLKHKPQLRRYIA